MGNNIARRFWALTTLAIVSGLGCSDITPPVAKSQMEAPTTALASLSSGTGVSRPITNGLPGTPCVDVAGGSHVAGTQVQIWGCAGVVQQSFSWMADGSIRVYTSTTPMCLTSMGTGQDGDRIQIQACAGSAQQKWTATSEGTIRGLNGKCLDVYNANPANGTPLMLWNCYGSPSQKWDNSGSSGTVATTVASVVVTLNASSLQVGQTTQASAVARDGSGAPISGASITWSSSNTAVATVSTSGLVTAVASGSASITATSSGKTGSQSLTVGSGSVSATGGSYGSAVAAALPRLSVNTTYPSVTRQVKVPAGANLQTAINNARLGDELLLAPGAVYTGQFYLPNKGSNSWIVIRTDLPDATIGLPGTRMTPSRAASVKLAKIMGSSTYGAMATNLGASHYRFTGVEFGSAVGGDINAIVRFGDATSAQNTVASIANNLILDRVYIHATSSQNVRRCVMLNSATSAVIDSWLSECHSNYGDSQAIVSWNGPGPFLIQNNHLEAGHEIVMFGGGSTTIQNQSPSDITVRGNHITRPSSWKGVWQAKNIIESKHAKRLLIENNVIEGIWKDAQAGFAFVLKSENQNGDNPWTQTADVTIRYNRIRNVGNVFNIVANPGPNVAVNAARFVITDNVVDNVNVGVYTAEGRLLQILGSLSDVVVMHNTMPTTTGGVSATVTFDTSPITRLVMHSNILHHGTYGVKGSGTGEGTASLTKYAPSGLFTNNALIAGGTASAYPANTFFAASITNLGFVNATGGDYRLSTSSAYNNKGYDGRNIGADVNTMNSRTASVVVGP